ncbi:MAG TPA: hypothetical protein VKM54_02635 [Myxococcota bacterium]|nr:hypothetical protein [Myxococcota bacterium]
MAAVVFTAEPRELALERGVEQPREVRRLEAVRAEGEDCGTRRLEEALSRLAENAPFSPGFEAKAAPPGVR